MKLTPLILGSVVIALIIGCEGNKRDNPDSTSGAETGSMQDSGMTGTATDTSMSGNGGASRADTTATGATGTTGSADQNQSQSGVTDTKTGESTLGDSATKTRPDEGQPTTAKGDTIGSTDSSATAR